MSKAIELARECFGVELIVDADIPKLESFYAAAFEAGRQAAITELTQELDGIEVKHD